MTLESFQVTYANQRYDGNVNKRIKQYLKEAGIPEHNELKSSHGAFRRLFIAYGYSLRDQPNQTLHSYIKDNLGHDEDSSTMHYNTLQVTSARVLEKDAAAKLEATHRATIELRGDVAELKEEITTATAAAPSATATATATVASVASMKVTPGTMAKFKKIEALVKEGKVKYADMERKGITAHVYSKWKKYTLMTQQRRPRGV